MKRGKVVEEKNPIVLAEVVEEKRGVGRPAIYNESFPLRAYKLCMLGLTDAQLSVAFGVSVDTIDMWKKVHTDFREAVHRGKEEADYEIVNSLYHKAKGFEHPDVVVTTYRGEVTLTPITKYYPPDTGAAIFWLKNRQRQNWRDVWALEHTGVDGKPIEVSHKEIIARMDMSKFSNEELEMVAAIGIKVKKVVKEKERGELTNEAQVITVDQEE